MVFKETVVVGNGWREWQTLQGLNVNGSVLWIGARARLSVQQPRVTNLEPNRSQLHNRCSQVLSNKVRGHLRRRTFGLDMCGGVSRFEDTPF